MATKKPKPERMRAKTTKSESDSSGREPGVSSLVGGSLKPDKGGGSAQKARRTKNTPRKPPPVAKRPAKTKAAPDGAEKSAEELTFKEQRFVEHYLCTGNATQSARQAGYTGSDDTLYQTGRRLLGKERVARAIRLGADASAEALLTSRASRIRWLLGVRDGTITMTQAMPTGEGIATITTETPPRERLKAAELLARMNGDLLEKVLTSNSLTDLVDSLPEDA